ncbi:catechol 1,2-dioxygenase [Xanthobacter autotrophicus]|uniref:catechol 1,2-dioxygenase n=1 Tax=Xanthobacter autotrophicus TaxID=280 RepID=UPI0024A78DAB|nr:catechol 1,2-dioxygenase [Xanthobacter autotrophicus]MDI4655990.1 catechol 1,2-dioxygenase [Xanthobacter autotrophicus]
MSKNIMSPALIDQLADRAAGLDVAGGDARLKEVVRRLTRDLMVAIDELDISMDEFWAGVAYVTAAGQSNELGLIVPGIAVEHYLDLRLDEAERLAGLASGTQRTIEGPLYVAGAPLSKGTARLDDGSDDGEVLFVQGRVTGIDGKPVEGAIVDVWHANTMGNYSHFDPTQPAFNLRRRIETLADGTYSFRTIMPAGYGCPPGSASRLLMEGLGRHAERPAHVHFFVTAPGYRKLTTQINIEGDQYLHTDFAFGTREGLIPAVRRVSDATEIHARGLNKPFAVIDFDFSIAPEAQGVVGTEVSRPRAAA